MDQNKGANGTVPPATNPIMSDEKRQKLAEILDSQLEDELEKLENSGSKYMDGWSEENWEEEMANHPFFANQQSLQNQEELSPLMKGLQDLKYSPDENTPSELAANYKEDGNFNFKCKKYRMAVISYTEGIRNLLIAISDLENTMDHVVMLYGYIRDKDIFERDYQQYLASRLLQDLSESEQSERSMIGKLKTESGYHWTSKLEDMFKDIQRSKCMNRDLENTRYGQMIAKVCMNSIYLNCHNIFSV